MPEIDVVHPLVNISGIGIGDGTLGEMLDAVKAAYECGKGIYSMKPLGGGNLLKSYDECMDFVLGLPYVHSIAIGMQSAEEVEMNVLKFEGREIPESLRNAAASGMKRLQIDFCCAGCGKCVKRCNPEKCVLCGYCSSACPEFAIKIC